MRLAFSFFLFLFFRPLVSHFLETVLSVCLCKEKFRFHSRLHFWKGWTLDIFPRMKPLLKTSLLSATSFLTLGNRIAQCLDHWTHDRKVPVPAGGRIFSRVNFLCWLLSVSVPPLCYCSNMRKIPVVLPEVQVAGYSYTPNHPTYVALQEVTWHGVWLYGVCGTRWDGSGFTSHIRAKQHCKYVTWVDFQSAVKASRLKI